MTVWSGDGDSAVRVGLDLSVSGTKITAKYYAGSGYSGGVSDDEVMEGYGSIDFKQGFHNSSSSGSPQLIATKTFTGSRGKTYSFGAKITGVYNGSTPSVTDSIKIPATVPSKMSKPSISSVTSSSATVSWSKPSGNGDTVDYAQIQVDNNSDFSSPKHSYTDSASPSYPNDLAANDTYYVRMRAHNSEGYGAWSDTASFKTKVLSPSAPTIGTPTRNSDTSVTVRWTRNSSTARPYESQQVYRRYYTGTGWSDWTRIASVSSTATSYTWTSASQGHVYQFMVKALNDAGSANSSDSGNVYTTPDAPTSVKATKNAAGNIVLTWAMGNDSGSVGSSIGFDIQESLAGSSTWTTKVSGVEAKTWTHAAPDPTKTHQYRVRTRVIASGLPGSGLASGYVNSQIVQLLTPPAAPTSLKYGPPGIVDRVLPITLSWVHNPIDSSDQTKFQVRHREVGATTWTTETAVTSDVSSWTLPGNTYLEATQVEWQVMTWGLHATGSPWSASNTISLSSKPDVALDSPAPAEVITVATLSPSWTFGDAEGEAQVGWEIQLTDLTNNALVESRAGSGEETTATFATRVRDGGAYEVSVRVKDQAGLWSPWASVNVTVEYALPPTPEITGTVWDPMTASVDIQFDAPTPTAGQADVDHFEIWRRIDDEEWRLLTDELPPDAQDYLDFFPTVSGRNTYLVVAVSAIPSESQSALTFVSRTNHALNPGAQGTPSGSIVPFFGTFGSGVGETGTTTVVGPGLDGPEVNGDTLGYARRTVTAQRTSGSTGWQARASGLRVPFVGTAATRLRVSIYARINAPTDPGSTNRQVRLRGEGFNGSTSVNYNDTAVVVMPMNEWVRIDVGYMPTGAFTEMGWWLYQSTGWNLPAGATFDVTGLLIEEAVELRPFFYGYTVAGADTEYSWVGTENASKSIASTLLSEVYVDTPQADDIQALWLNARSQPATAGRLFHNLTIQTTASIEKALNRFAGRPLPVESTGLSETIEWQVSGKLHTRWAKRLDEEGMERIWEDLGRLRGPHLLRAPTPKLHEWVSIDGLTVQRAQGGNTYDVSFTATKVDLP